MSRRVVVVGAGLAGLAAAWAARDAGAEVTLVSEGVGASALGSGAVDDAPWDELARAAKATGQAPASRLDERASAFVYELDLWNVPADERAIAATTAGRLRGARGLDRAILDLASLGSAVVALPRVERAGWDADALAVAFADDPLARARGLRFLAIDADLLKLAGEERVADADLAARHDDVDRVAWLAERVRAAIASLGLEPSSSSAVGAVLVGPWLGLERARAGQLAQALNLPIGEALSAGSATAGLRFENARRRLLDRLDVTRLDARATAIAVPRRPGELVEVTVARAPNPLRVDAVVLATGGLIGGGVVYAPPESLVAGDLPLHGGTAFRLSIDVDAPIGAPREGASGVRGDGVRALGVASSMQGPSIDLDAWPRGDDRGVLERVGVLADRRGRVSTGLYVAGDVWAGRPRTALEAVRSGVAVGAAAAAVQAEALEAPAR